MKTRRKSFHLQSSSPSVVGARRSVAKNPQASPRSLERLLQTNPIAVAEHPNASMEQLRQLLCAFPKEVQANPAFILFTLQEPDWGKECFDTLRYLTPENTQRARLRWVTEGSPKMSKSVLHRILGKITEELTFRQFWMELVNARSTDHHLIRSARELASTLPTTLRKFTSGYIQEIKPGGDGPRWFEDEEDCVDRLSMEWTNTEYFSRMQEEGHWPLDNWNDLRQLSDQRKTTPVGVRSKKAKREHQPLTRDEWHNLAVENIKKALKHPDAPPDLVVDYLDENYGRGLDARYAALTENPAVPLWLMEDRNPSDPLLIAIWRAKQRAAYDYLIKTLATLSPETVARFVELETHASVSENSLQKLRDLIQRKGRRVAQYATELLARSILVDPDLEPGTWTFWANYASKLNEIQARIEKRQQTSSSVGARSKKAPPVSATQEEINQIHEVTKDQGGQYEWERMGRWGQRHVDLLRKMLHDPLLPGKTIGEITTILAAGNNKNLLKTAARHPNLPPPNHPEGWKAWHHLFTWAPKDALKALVSNKMYLLEGPGLVTQVVEQNSLHVDADVVASVLKPIASYTFQNLHKNWKNERWWYYYPCQIDEYPFDLYLSYGFSSMGIGKGHPSLYTRPKMEEVIAKYIYSNAVQMISNYGERVRSSRMASLPTSLSAFLAMSDQAQAGSVGRRTLSVGKGRRRASS